MSVQTCYGLAPAADGSITLPETIDFNRKHNPQASAFVFAHEDGSGETTTITHLEFGRAADRVANILRPGRLGADKEIIGVVALSDTILYHAVLIGIMRAGYIPFPMSPRNTAAAIIKMVKETSCHRMIATQETLKSLVLDVQEQLLTEGSNYQLSFEEMPAFPTVYPRLGKERMEDPFEPYPAGPRPSLDDINVYLHSSGSTGLPKSIKQTFRIMIEWARCPTVTSFRDHPHPQISAGHSAPCFHTMGFIAQLIMPLYGLIPIGVYPPTAQTPTTQPMVPTPKNIIDHTKQSRSTNIVVPPALLQLWANDPEMVKFLTSLDFVIFAGGPLPSKIGNAFTEAGVYVTPTYGATEFGIPVHTLRRPGDEMEWEYIEFAEYTNLRMVPQGDGTYEAQFLNSGTHHVAVENLPDVPGYNSADLFERHPTKSYFWKIVGRADDVIVHNSGEKTVPAPMENVMMSNPHLSGVVMFGRERDQAGVLIELKPTYGIDVTDEKQVAEARNLIWPTIEEANKVCPAFSRIFKELILFTSKDKPLPRAGKGTVMRKAALNVYKEEIDVIYAQVQATSKGDDVTPPASWTQADVQAWLVAQITEINATKNNTKAISSSDDLFDQGLDSLSATILRRRIVGGLQAPAASSSETGQRIQEAAQKISQMTIYDNPSIDKLTTFLVKLVCGGENRDDDSETRVESIERMISKYSEGLSDPISVTNNSNNSRTSKDAVVLISGTTGNLGAQLLEEMLKREDVKKVYALNRPSKKQSSKDRHVERFQDKGLALELLDDPRLVYLEGDASEDRMEQSEEVYHELLQSVNVIIHNAWRLDFNLPLSSFEANIRGTRKLIDFARSSDNGSSVKFLFTSSIASANSWDTLKGKYPEEVVTDAKYAVGNGYGESKYVTERILSQSGLDTISFRIGQIAGPQSSGAWAITDWVPIIVKSSVTLGAFPSCSGVVSWIPMDAVAQSMLDVSLTSQPTNSHHALNIVHPQPVSWDSVADNVVGALSKQGVTTQKIPLVEFSEWFGLLEKAAGDESILEDLPAARLMNFFRHVADADADVRKHYPPTVQAANSADFSTESIRTVSHTMQSLSPLESADAEAWVGYWNKAGLFDSKKRKREAQEKPTAPSVIKRSKSG